MLWPRRGQARGRHPVLPASGLWAPPLPRPRLLPRGDAGMATALAVGERGCQGRGRRELAAPPHGWRGTEGA